MSTTHEATVWCDGRPCHGHRDGRPCPEWAQSQGSLVTFRRHLKAHGWSRRKVDGEMKDYCPKCTKARES